MFIGEEAHLERGSSLERSLIREGVYWKVGYLRTTIGEGA